MTTGESITGFDFFEAGELPVPLVSTELAERWAEEAFGLVVRAVDLGSQQDANFLLVDAAGTSDVAEGTPVAVMKISNSAFDTDTVEDQDHAAQWVADSAAALRTPTRVGELAVLEASSGSHIVRLIRYLDGGTLHGSGYLSPATVAEMGRVCGEVSAALANLPTTPAERVLQWDLRQGPRVVEFLAEHIADADLRERVTLVTQAEARRVGRVASQLPVQVVHGDLTDDNLMRSAAPEGERLPGWRDRLRRPDAVLARRRARDHHLIRLAPRRRILLVGSARDSVIPPDSSAERPRGRSIVAARRHSRGRARGERAPAGGRRRVQRLRPRRASP